MKTKKYNTKDSGKRVSYKSGMNRDIQEGKPRFDLIVPQDVPYDQTVLYKWAMLMERGMAKYGYRNWEKSNSKDELNRFKSSAFRHFMQWIQNISDGEDHAAAILFNVNAAEFLKDKGVKK